MNQIDQNTLFYGDNLKILRDYIPDESVDFHPLLVFVLVQDFIALAYSSLLSLYYDVAQ